MFMATAAAAAMAPPVSVSPAPISIANIKAMVYPPVFASSDAWRDVMQYGVSISRDGKRIDPVEFFIND